MKLGTHGLLTALILVSVSYGSKAEENAAALKFEYEVFEEKVKKDFETQRADLYDKYAAAVRRQQDVFRKEGDLDNALAAKSEADLAETERKHGETEFPGAINLRETLLKSLTQIEEAELAQYEKLRQRYIHLAGELQVRLTKANDLEEAVSARNFSTELKQMSDEAAPASSTPAGSASLPSMITSNDGGTKKLNLVFEEHSQSVLHSKKPVTGDHVLLPGRYRNLSSVKLGDRQAKDETKRKASLKVPPGSEVSNGHIFADMGALELQESYFTEVRFGQNLGSSFAAVSCVFSECTFAKEGGWGSALSSRWTFENCVISASFFKDWRKRRVGVQIRNSTFEDVDFAPYPYHEDAGKEATDQWFVFERCLFRNCTIPESLLIATKDCAFENCKIVPDEIKISSDVRVTLYEQNSTLDLPATREHITYVLKSFDQLTNKNIGSNLDYSVKAKKAIPNP